MSYQYTGAHRALAVPGPRSHTAKHRLERVSTGRRAGAGLAAAACGVGAATALLGGPATASAGAAPAASAPRADVMYAWQDESTNRVYVRGHAVRGSSSHATTVSLSVDGHHVKTVTADAASPLWDKHRHLQGDHGFSTVVSAPADAHVLTVQLGKTVLARFQVAKRASAGDYIVSIARKHLSASYRYGAEGPRSFDCSGYAAYVYRAAGIQALPHNSESQRHVAHMRHISRSQARPGDLVFYLSGGDAYHVSIYAGHGRQYSATNPQRGVEYSPIWAHNVVYATDWH